MPAFRLTLAYDGTDFHGSQSQAGQRTVQGELLRVLQSLGEDPARVTLAGRTDRGVHAVGQVAAIWLPRWRGTADALERALSAGMPRDLAVADIRQCDASFHPRFDAVWREYRYWIAPQTRDPRLGRYAWLPRAALDVQAMAEAAARLAGTHDFATFAGGGEGVPWSERARRRRGTTRTMYRCECRRIELYPRSGDERDVGIVEVRAVADGFLPRMVRNIVGALAEIGQGRREPGWIDELLAARDRRQGPPVAPAHGLTLWAVGYGQDAIDSW